MDICHNVSVSEEFHSNLDDLFPAHNTEVDFGMEWLSVFVEECFSSKPSCVLAPSSVQIQTTTSTNTKPSNTLKKQNHSYLQNFVVPGKARSKRKRLSHPSSDGLSLDPPLLKQAYWLADSELIVPKKKDEQKVLNKVGNFEGPKFSVVRDTRIRNCRESNFKFDGVKFPAVRDPCISNCRKSNFKFESCRLSIVADVSDRRESDFKFEKESFEDSFELEISNKNNNDSEENPNPNTRRCTHCLSQKTPQWRAGPLGPKTLCNACGVRYKSGRLLPEYRPAKSPTFVSYLHSNSHKKVMEMRMQSIPL